MTKEQKSKANDVATLLNWYANLLSSARPEVGAEHARKDYREFLEQFLERWGKHGAGILDVFSLERQELERVCREAGQELLAWFDDARKRLASAVANNKRRFVKNEKLWLDEQRKNIERFIGRPLEGYAPCESVGLPEGEEQDSFEISHKPPIILGKTLNMDRGLWHWHNKPSEPVTKLRQVVGKIWYSQISTPPESWLNFQRMLGKHSWTAVHTLDLIAMVFTSGMDDQRCAEAVSWCEQCSGSYDKAKGFQYDSNDDLVEREAPSNVLTWIGGQRDMLSMVASIAKDVGEDTHDSIQISNQGLSRRLPEGKNAIAPALFIAFLLDRLTEWHRERNATSIHLTSDGSITRSLVIVPHTSGKKKYGVKLATHDEPISVSKGVADMICELLARRKCRVFSDIRSKFKKELEALNEDIAPVDEDAKDDAKTTYALRPNVVWLPLPDHLSTRSSTNVHPAAQH